MKYLIDGYNVIFECGLHERQVNLDTLAKARKRLLQTISSSLPQEDVGQTTVVFDAQKIPLSGQTEKSTYGNITVLYSIHFEDADSMIEQLISTHSAAKNLVVVSSDHRIQNAALRRKSKPIDSQVWYDWLTRQPSENVSESHPLQPETAATLTEAEIAMLSQAAQELVRQQEEEESCSDRREKKEETAIDKFNPFPDGYVDDLLDDDLEDLLDDR